MIIKTKQSGFAILLLTVTLLLISTLLILFGARYSSLQQKIAASLYVNQQAFEAAQAGVEAAIPYFQANYAAIIAAQSGGFLTPYINSNTQNVVLANGSRYSFVFSNPTANNYQLITITSTGTSADSTSSRVIVQQIKSASSGPTPPTSTLTSQGSITLANSASINNTDTNFNINAGGSVSFANSSHTTTDAGVTSNSSGQGSDITANNSSIASMSTDAFFQSIFGVNQATVQSAATYSYTYGSDQNFNSLNGVTGAVIWINQTSGVASISGNTIIGSAAQPVIIIVNGNLKISNNVTIYGLVFTMNSSSALVESNSITINGAIASTNNLEFKNAAALNYDTSVLNALPSVGGSSSNYAKVAASWRDF